MINAFFLLIPLLAVTAAQAGVTDELTADELARLKNGEQVYRTENVSGVPWPRITLFQLAKATPEETAAISIDFEAKPAYTTRLKSSRILKQETPTTSLVEYITEIPIFSDERVVHRFEISSYAEDSYLLRWKLVKGKRTKRSEGSMHMEPYGSETVVRFEGLLHPGIPMAGKFKGVALDQTLQQSDGFVKEVEREHTAQSAHLKERIRILRRALGN